MISAIQSRVYLAEIAIRTQDGTKRVYRKRFFTKRGARDWMVRKITAAHCTCEIGNETDGFSYAPCRLHDSSEDYAARARRRLERWIKTATDES